MTDCLLLETFLPAARTGSDFLRCFHHHYSGFVQHLFSCCSLVELLSFLLGNFGFPLAIFDAWHTISLPFFHSLDALNDDKSNIWLK